MVNKISKWSDTHLAPNAEKSLKCGSDDFRTLHIKGLKSSALINLIFNDSWLNGTCVTLS